MTVRPIEGTRQHYVPQLLLRGFASGKHKQIYVFDKSTRKIFRTSIQNIACERDFYEYDGQSDKFATDPWLQDAENRAAPLIQRIRSRQSLKSLQDIDRSALAIFVAAQAVRTKARKEQRFHLNTTFTDLLRQMGADLTKIENYKELSLEEVRVDFISSVRQSAVKLFPYFVAKDWVLFNARKPLNFWLSDHPVVLDNNFNKGDGVRGTLGFAVEGVEVYLPISSYLVLGFLCPTIRARLEHAQTRMNLFGLDVPGQSRKFTQALRDQCAVEQIAENLTYFNSLQVINAERYIFSEFNNFELVNQMLSDNPELVKGQRFKPVNPGRRE